MRPLVVIEVDPGCCVGSSVCLSLAPAVFQLNAEGQASVRDAGGASLDAILEAAEGCPTMAIRVRDAVTGDSLFPLP